MLILICIQLRFCPFNDSPLESFLESLKTDTPPVEIHRSPASPRSTVSSISPISTPRDIRQIISKSVPVEIEKTKIDEPIEVPSQFFSMYIAEQKIDVKPLEVDLIEVCKIAVEYLNWFSQVLLSLLLIQILKMRKWNVLLDFLKMLQC